MSSEDQENEREQVHALAVTDITDITVKHKLNRRWTLWFDSQQKRATQSNWHDALKNLITFDTVEDFWGVYNNVIKASGLSAGSNFHLFQAGIEPMWEDPQNEKGGKWVAQVTKARASELDTLWLNTILSVIGENFEDAEEILGAVVSVRRQGNRLGLWTKSFDDGEKCIRVGTEWKKALGYAPEEMIGFQAHSDAISHNSSFANKERHSV
ncbi:putative eukaryotic initiation factor 4E [Rhizoclosmatium globosum]|uniref:Putative eukaryotic initiation factor 4E n=1 Tax=Rhizoclosmatium globosum TaxID=329046 RepID=A0A1Y2BNI7_9FUNG|nr:putative eukaryotic initiation factor 4E [Rhizoclosmatium globosum]|eukprot:ORY36306.1 putative eukaryotic initiation factor 4E [Rhizoclosmatium globosum]